MNTKIQLIGGLIAGLLIAISASLIAGPVTIPNAFTSKTTAKASEVNANFNAVATEMNDNDTRITKIQSLIHDFGPANIFVGQDAGNITMTGSTNTATGLSAFHFNTTGSANTATGAQTLSSNTTGTSNTASGVQALGSNTTGDNNTATGVQALDGNTTGDDNTASGFGALGNNTTGDNNTAIGREALGTNMSGVGNTAIGVAALRNSTGSSNIALGPAAGFNLTTGNGNIAIGNVGAAGESNTTRIGDGQTRAFIAGIRGVTTGAANAIAVVVDSNGQLGTVSSSRRVKDGIADMDAASEVLRKLRPVTFYYKSDRNPEGRTLQYGLVAEEVEKIAPGLVARSASGKVETVYYRFLPPMLLNEYQKQQRTIEALKARIDAQAAEIAVLKRQRADITKLKQRVAQLTVARTGFDQVPMVSGHE